MQATGLPDGLSDIGGLAVVVKNGEARVIHMRAFPVRGRKGQVDRIAGIAEDVSERIRVEQLREDLTHTMVHA